MTPVELQQIAARIRQVGRGLAIPTGASVIDLGRSTCLPGLIDSHVHPVFGDWTPRQGQLGWIEVADQAAAVRQLADRGILAAGGVGAVGGSYGGFVVILAMALEPELFTVGVAIAPVIEWTAYDTAYTERYLGTPAANQAAYRSSSALSHAAAVRGDLLVIHGTADENVHLRHSQRLVEALRGAGHPVELVELPEQRHRTRGGAIRVREERTVAHLLRGLSLPLPEEPA